MNDLDLVVSELQKEFCAGHQAMYVPSLADSKLGFALRTKGKEPVNGLRHSPQGETSGWYIWCGQEYSQAPDFFAPIHARHIYEEVPQLTKLLGLPPGYRFLLAGDYLDVWYDENLLKVND